MARFFLAQHRAAPAEGRAGRPAYLTADAATLGRGQGRVRRALRALPLEQAAADLPAGLDLENCNGKDYLALLGQVLGMDQDRRRSRTQMRPIVAAADFLDGQLSVDRAARSRRRCCRPTSAARSRPTRSRGNIWDNFSSQSYKELPSVGTVKIRNPFTGAESDYALPGGGRGFTRPASLVSLWSTAPFLQNNSVGPFDPSPSVEARMQVVPGLDRADALAGAAREGQAVHGISESNGRGRRQDPAHLCRTATSACRRATSPTGSRPLIALGQRLFPMFFRDGEVVHRTDSRGHARQPAHEHGPHRRGPAARTAARRTSKKLRRRCSSTSGGS